MRCTPSLCVASRLCVAKPRRLVPAAARVPRSARTLRPAVHAAPTRQPLQPGRRPCISASSAAVSTRDRFERWTAPGRSAAAAWTRSRSAAAPIRSGCGAELACGRG